MMVVPTRKTALVAGGFTTLSLTLFDRLTPHSYGNPALARLGYLAAALILWVLPALFLVTGFDLKRWNPDYIYSPGAQADYREIGVRTCFWFAGSIVAAVAIRAAM